MLLEPGWLCELSRDRRNILPELRDAQLHASPRAHEPRGPLRSRKQRGSCAILARSVELPYYVSTLPFATVLVVLRLASRRISCNNETDEYLKLFSVVGKQARP